MLRFDWFISLSTSIEIGHGISMGNQMGGKLFDFGQNASEIIPYFHDYTI